MNRRKLLKGALGSVLGGGLFSANSLLSAPAQFANHARTQKERVLLFGIGGGSLSVEMLMATQGMWLDDSRYSLKGQRYLPEQQRAQGHFGELSAGGILADRREWLAAGLSEVDHLWIVGLQEFELTDQEYRSQLVFMIGNCARTSLTVETAPSIDAAYDALNLCEGLAPYSDCRVVAVPDLAWDRFIERWGAAGGDVLTKEYEDLYRLYQWERCDALAGGVVETLGSSHAHEFKPSHARSARNRDSGAIPGDLRFADWPR